jgi:nicotinate-nucleotide adenylyltransferase
VRSATAIRQANPRWFESYAGRALRDPVTHSRLAMDERNETA